MNCYVALMLAWFVIYNRLGTDYEVQSESDTIRDKNAIAYIAPIRTMADDFARAMNWIHSKIMIEEIEIPDCHGGSCDPGIIAPMNGTILPCSQDGCGKQP